METGSEVYMSELLVSYFSLIFDSLSFQAGFDMDDFDEVDEQNEEDLLLLGDEFAKVQNLKQFLLTQFDEFANEEKYS